jgi:hypothetical protein
MIGAKGDNSQQLRLILLIIKKVVNKDEKGFVCLSPLPCWNMRSTSTGTIVGFFALLRLELKASHSYHATIPHFFCAHCCLLLHPQLLYHSLAYCVDVQ